MRVLIYKWGSVSESLFGEALKNLNVEYTEYAKTIKDYHFDADFAAGMIEKIHKENVDLVFSYDYFPLISMLCEINRIPYVSWIYDCPQYTTWSKTIISPYNYIFCFDREFAGRLCEMGAVHCEHYPLAGDLQMLEKAALLGKVEEKSRYACEVSFIGNLYNGDKNRYRNVQFSSYTAGFTEGIISAQQQIYGQNFVREALLEQPEVIAELVEKCKLSLGEQYIQDNLQLAADVLGMEISAREREEMLCLLSEHVPVTLYTASKLPKNLQKDSLITKGYADYEKELPLIYYSSKINLNITSKTIVSGIPQRVFDILSCGGFCLTNYQPEIAEYFENGKELVMYESGADLIEKVIYYLNHEEERKQIARNGLEKIKEHFSMTQRVADMLNAFGGK